jgi:Na+/H+ antiporter NhaC
MTIFEPSTLLAVFPYVFISAFPIFGIILVTWWIIKDKKSSKTKTKKKY